MVHENKKYDVVMLSMSNIWEWTQVGFANRNLHIFNQLQERPEVGKILHVDYLPYNIKRAFLGYLRNVRHSEGEVIEKSITSRLSRLGENLYRYSTIDSVFSTDNASQKINDVLDKLDFKNVILWSYLPMFVDIFKHIKSDVKIFDAVDNWAEHPGYQGIWEDILDSYQQINQEADVIFTVSKDLVNLFPENKNAHWIPNGVDVEHFGRDAEVNNLELKNLAKGRKVVGYVGIIQKRFDVELVEHVIKNNQDKYFVFVGMVWPDAGAEKLKKFENVDFIGHKKYQDLPNYISQFDVAIIPHKVDEFTKSMNPLKVYEYLAAGKPVIATDVAGVGEFDDLVYMAKSKEEFSSKINQALKEDDVEIIKARKDISKKHSWSDRVDAMFEKINSVNNN